MTPRVACDGQRTLDLVEIQVLVVQLKLIFAVYDGTEVSQLHSSLLRCWGLLCSLVGTLVLHQALFAVGKGNNVIRATS